MSDRHLFQRQGQNYCYGNFFALSSVCSLLFCNLGQPFRGHIVPSIVLNCEVEEQRNKELLDTLSQLSLHFIPVFVDIF